MTVNAAVRTGGPTPSGDRALGRARGSVRQRLTRGSRIRPYWAVALAALLAIFGIGSAFAASLGVTPAALTAANIAGGSGAPTVYSWDNFNRVITPLQGTSMPSGAFWKSQIGTWTANGTTARATTLNTDTNTLTDAPSSDASMVVTITPKGVARPGVTFNDDSTNNDMLLLYNSAGGGTLTLYTYFGPTRVFLASGGGVGPIGTPFELRVTSKGADITVSVNGVQKIAVTLTGTNLCKAKDLGPGCIPDGVANNGFGLWADNDTSSTFDDFRLESA